MASFLIVVSRVISLVQSQNFSELAKHQTDKPTGQTKRQNGVRRPRMEDEAKREFGFLILRHVIPCLDICFFVEGPFAVWK